MASRVTGRSAGGSARRWGAVLAGCLLVVLCGCAEVPRLATFAPELPEGRPGAQEADYPNINEAPDRPSDLRSPEEQEALEQELETLGSQHVRKAERTIETTNRRQ